MVELCDERFDSQYNKLMKHPKYELIMSHFQKILDDDDKVLDFSKKSKMIDMQNLEYLIGMFL